MTEQRLVPQFDTALSEALDEYLANGNFTAALSAIADNKYVAALKTNCSDTINVVLKYLTDDNFDENSQLFDTAENLLKIVATEVNPEEVLFELLEIIETTQSDNVFTSTLKSLQICILRQNKNKARSLEWCLNSIHLYFDKLPIDQTVIDDVEVEAERLLEENPIIRRIISNYLTLFLFCEPIQRDMEAGCDQQDAQSLFRDVRITRHNIYGCFLLQQLGKPLCYLDLSLKDGPKASTNTYSRQCATTLVNNIVALFPDPFIFMPYVERKLQFPKELKFGADGAVHENAPQDIFAIDEKLPMNAICIFYYLIFAENLMPASCPSVYSHLYLLEVGLAIVGEILKCNENVLHRKALKLADALLGKMGTSERIECHCLEQPVYEQFTMAIARIITQSPHQANSQFSALLLKRFVLQFDEDGRYFIIKRLFAMIDHSPLFGYLVYLYKTMIAEALDTDQNQICNRFSGSDFVGILLKYICVLKSGSETDLIQNADHIITALNCIRFIALRDRTNRTGFWNQIDEMDEQYLKPLRVAIDMSRAHYQLEAEKSTASRQNDGFTMEMIPKALNTFDLIDSLLSRINECVRGAQSVNINK